MNKTIYTVGILMVLFMVLSPGFILNFPPYKNRFKSKYIFFTGSSSALAVIVHSIIFSILAYVLLTNYTLVSTTVSAASSIVPQTVEAVKSTAQALKPLVNQLATSTP